MLLGGLWHGSSWNFVVWGAIHGILLSVEKRFSFVPKKYNFFKNIIIFSTVSLIWVFFRALSFQDSIIIFTKLFTGDYLLPYIGNINSLAVLLYGLFFAIIFDVILFKKNIHLENFGSTLKPFSYTMISVFVLINIVLFYSSASNFIYFQF
jgi:hypothetical protein